MAVVAAAGKEAAAAAASRAGAAGTTRFELTCVGGFAVLYFIGLLHGATHRHFIRGSSLLFHSSERSEGPQTSLLVGAFPNVGSSTAACMAGRHGRMAALHADAASHPLLSTNGRYRIHCETNMHARTTTRHVGIVQASAVLMQRAGRLGSCPSAHSCAGRISRCSSSVHSPVASTAPAGVHTAPCGPVCAPPPRAA